MMSSSLFENGSSSSSCEDVVAVPRALLREVIADGCCALSLRLRLTRLLEPSAARADQNLRGVDGSCCSEVTMQQISAQSDAAAVEAFPRRSSAAGEPPAPSEQLEALALLDSQCLATIASYLPLDEVLSVRACGREPLQWATEYGAEEQSSKHRWIHNRIRARTWLQRVQDVTAGTKDESVFETRMRNLADEALRSRMETEMQEALQHMEQQIHQFQADVDRRLEEQESQVRRMVEERVQQQLDVIMQAEAAKVQAMVEERVRERVAATFRHEVRETVRELKAKLDALVDENEVLRDAFAEANLRAKCLFWAQHAPLLNSMSPAMAYLGPAGSSTLLSLKRRVAVAATWHPALERPSRRK